MNRSRHLELNLRNLAPLAAHLDPDPARSIASWQPIDIAICVEGFVGCNSFKIVNADCNALRRQSPGSPALRRVEWNLLRQSLDAPRSIPVVANRSTLNCLEPAFKGS